MNAATEVKKVKREKYEHRHWEDMKIGDFFYDTYHSAQAGNRWAKAHGLNRRFLSEKESEGVFKITRVR